MAENDNAVLSAAVGYVYVAAVGTAAPTPAALKTINLENPSGWTATGWTSVGHTSRGKMPEFGYDGGDPEIKGTWQKKKLREIIKDDPIDHLKVTLHEFGEDALALYYGENSVNTEGLYSVTSGFQAVERAALVVIEDETVRLGFHALKAAVRRDASIDLPIDDLAMLPIKFTFLDHAVGSPLFTWINEDLYNPAP